MQIFSSFSRLPVLLLGLLLFSFNDVSRSKLNYQKAVGFVPSLVTNAVISASSNSIDLPKIHDGDPGTFWQSDAPLPEGFIQRNDLNYFYKKAATFFPFSDGAKICDGDLNNAVFIKKSGDKASLKITFPKAKYLHSISTKLQMQGEVNIVAILKNGQKKPLQSCNLSKNYQLQRTSWSSSEHGSRVDSHGYQTHPLISYRL